MNEKEITLYYCDIDEHRQDKKLLGEINKYKVKQIPYVIIYRNKNIEATLIGEKSESEIREFLEKVL